jgi:hypothetical protein
VKTREFFGNLPQSGEAPTTILVTCVSAKLTNFVTLTAD